MEGLKRGVFGEFLQIPEDHFVLQSDFSWSVIVVAEGKGGGGGGCGGLFSSVFLVGGELSWQRERAAVAVCSPK